MAMRIEDYAMIGDCRTAALVGRDGSIDWLCAPRFDSPACFAALLGTREHGRWLLAPAVKVRAVRRRDRSDTLGLETEFETADGTVRLIDCMPAWPGRTDAGRCRGRDRGDRAGMARLVRALRLRWPLGRRGQAIADHIEGSRLRSDRRHRRRANDVAAGAHRRRAQLGLSVLLAARCDVY